MVMFSAEMSKARLERQLSKTHKDLCIQSGVALRLPPHSKSVELRLALFNERFIRFAIIRVLHADGLRLRLAFEGRT